MTQNYQHKLKNGKVFSTTVVEGKKLPIYSFNQVPTNINQNTLQLHSWKI